MSDLSLLHSLFIDSIVSWIFDVLISRLGTDLSSIFLICLFSMSSQLANLSQLCHNSTATSHLSSILFDKWYFDARPGIEIQNHHYSLDHNSLSSRRMLPAADIAGVIETLFVLLSSKTDSISIPDV